ncbi:hypothetical protein K443DRAFT_92244, partial [Laccaria amethystina LaAM-08-1]
IFTKHGNWQLQLQLITNMGNCNWKKTGLWFNPVHSYTGPANTSCSTQLTVVFRSIDITHLLSVPTVSVPA